MRREFHVRFCEGLGVRFPRATRLVIVCANERDARRISAVLPKRLDRYGLTINAEKTRLVDFRPGPRPPSGGRGGGQSFDLLGLTHYWGRSRKGRWIVKRKTAKGRFQRTLKRVGQWLRRNLHRPVREQQQRLSAMLKGHDAYFGITGNSASLQRLRWEILCLWRRWLNRRSNSSTMTWDIFNRLLGRYPLPPARVVHSIYRRAAKTSS